VGLAPCGEISAPLLLVLGVRAGQDVGHHLVRHGRCGDRETEVARRVQPHVGGVWILSAYHAVLGVNRADLAWFVTPHCGGVSLERLENCRTWSVGFSAVWAFMTDSRIAFCSCRGTKGSSGQCLAMEIR
jgi:hypothetical protein